MFSYSGGMSKADQKRFREQKTKSASNLLKEEHARIMRGFAEALQNVSIKYASLIQEQRSQCAAEYAAIREETERGYREAHAKLLAVRREKKVRKADECRFRRDLIKKQRAEEREIVRAQRAEEQRYWRDLANIERANKSRSKDRAKHSSSRERRQESDQEVANNLDPMLLPAWRAVKRQIKGNDRRSRTEAFVEWAEANIDDVTHYAAEEAEREAAKEFRRGNRRRKVEDDSDVPF